MTVTLLKPGAGGLVVPLKKKSNAGRKATYTAANYENVLHGISRGLSIMEACNRPQGVSVRAFNRWRHADPRNEQAFKDAQADQTHDAVDAVFARIDERLKSKLSETVRARYEGMRADHVRWVASRRNPRDYGNNNVAPVDNVATVVNALPVDSPKGGDDAEN